MNLFDQLMSNPLDRPPSWIDAPPKGVTLDRNDSGPFRVYVDEGGIAYPSVTTVLSHGQDHSWLEEWKSRVGEKRAEEISERSRVRGTRMHAALESALKGDRDHDRAAEFDGEAVLMARAMASALFPRMSRVVASELMMRSKRLKIAGTVDNVSDFDEELSIVDFKNSRRVKQKEDIRGYFLQTCLYAMMYADNYDELPKKLVVGISYGDSLLGRCDVFIENTEDWMKEAIEVPRRFHRDPKNSLYLSSFAI